MAALLRLFFFVSLALLAYSTPISAGKRDCEVAPTEKDTCVTLTRRGPPWLSEPEAEALAVESVRV
ncbi:hypothetical protein BDZ89DRAFT_1062547 [Hymenopellis radicata]|nr:hypothetical protein BDZ89DRAFT_1062547 [Hymenopellis radicata]